MPIADGGGLPSNPFYAFLQDVERAINSGVAGGEGLADAVTAIARALGSPDGSVANIPEQSQGSGQILGPQSIHVNGALPNMVQIVLEGDAVDPGPTFCYGTDAEGAKGWFPIADALAGSVTATLTVGADGVVTFSLPELPDAGTGTFKLLTRDQYGRLSGTADGTTGDVPEGSNLYHTAERVDARITAQKAQPGGLATLDANAKLDAGQLPALAITETFVVNTEAAMLALDVQQGDVAVRSDLQASFILTADPASTLSNWQELLVPTGVGVASFNGRTGTVIPQTGDYTPAQVGAATAAQGAKADSAVQGSDARLSDSREWTATTVSQAEAEAGIATPRRAWTAQRVRQAITAWWAGSAAKTMLDGLVVQTITSGDTTHAPSGDAVFDAMVGKQDALDSGGYIPTGSSETNVSGVNGFSCYWFRIGDVVYIDGRVDISATSAGQCIALVTLPVPSDFSAFADAAGTLLAVPSGGAAGNPYAPGVVNASATSDMLRFIFPSSGAFNSQCTFHCAYQVK